MSYDRQDLAAFAAVAEHGTVGRAAAALNSTQPTLSRQIRALERQLGQTLFDRHAQGMTLTPAGAVLLPRVRLVLHEMLLAQEEMDAIRGVRRGTLRVGGVAAVTRGFLPQILAEVARRAPQLRIEVLESTEERLDSALALREVDVVFTAEVPREVETVPVGTRQFEDRCVAFCSKGHALHTQSEVTLSQIAQQTWAMPHRGAAPRLHFERLVREHALPAPVVTLQTDSIDLTIAFVARSEVLGWLPVHLLAGPVAAGEIALLEIPQLEWRRTFRPFRRANGSFPPAAQFLVDAMAAKYETP